MDVGILDDISNETVTTNKPKRPTRDEVYYFQGSVVFHVRNIY